MAQTTLKAGGTLPQCAINVAGQATGRRSVRTCCQMAQCVTLPPNMFCARQPHVAVVLTAYAS